MGDVTTEDSTTTLLLVKEGALVVGELNDGDGEETELNDGEGEEYILVRIDEALLEDGAGGLYILVLGEKNSLDDEIMNEVLGE